VLDNGWLLRKSLEGASNQPRPVSRQKARGVVGAFMGQRPRRAQRRLLRAPPPRRDATTGWLTLMAPSAQILPIPSMPQTPTNLQGATSRLYQSQGGTAHTVTIETKTHPTPTAVVPRPLAWLTCTSFAPGNALRAWSAQSTAPPSPSRSREVPSSRSASRRTSRRPCS
jgi:hypothetical protein